MRHLLAPLLARLRRSVEEPVTPPLPTAADQVSPELARGICDKLDRAIRLGEMKHADRIARTAIRLVREQPRVAERVARLRLLEHRPDAAIAVIESCRFSSASLRLLKSFCLIQVNRVGDAHLDLQRWARKATAPLGARQLLAILDRSSGNPRAAIGALLSNLQHMEDPDSLAMLITMGVEDHRLEETSAWSERLWEATSYRRRHEETAMMLHSMGISATQLQREPAASHVNALAIELAACETVIPALVEAHRHQLDQPSAMLLAKSIEQALPDLAAPAAANEALARLDLQLGNIIEARDRAAAVLQSNPMSASAALLVRECNDALYKLDDAGNQVAGSIGPADQEKAA